MKRNQIGEVDGEVRLWGKGVHLLVTSIVFFLV